MDRRPKVGIFDSGIGGLSVLRACLARIPQARYYYFGDNGNAPYGSLPKEEIARLTGRALAMFERRGADLAVVACNTATAVCIGEMRKRFSFPVVGVEPAVAQAAKAHREVLVLATPRTAESDRLKTLIDRFPETHFTVFPAPRLAAAVEAHFCRGERLALSVHIPEIRCDCAVLGCTHYALIADEIAKYLHCPVYDGAEGTAGQVARLLSEKNPDHFRPHRKRGQDSIKQNKFSSFSINFLGESKHMNRYVFITNICSQSF